MHSARGPVIPTRRVSEAPRSRHGNQARLPSRYTRQHSLCATRPEPERNDQADPDRPSGAAARQMLGDKPTRVYRSHAGLLERNKPGMALVEA